MGIAAYNRGSRAIRTKLDQAQRPEVFALMDDLNATPKYPDASTPFGPALVYADRQVWVMECPITGFSYWYPTLRELLRRWRVTLTAYDAGTDRWTAVPLR